MPLRDHFHPPLSTRKNWEGFHGLWPGLITVQLNELLPAQYEAEPSVHVGSEIEVDVAALETENGAGTDNSLPPGPSNGYPNWNLAAPSLRVETDLLTESEYEVNIFDTRRNRRLVAAIEIVSPANKDRPESRQLFVAKCQALLKKGVSVAIVDLVTSKQFNLYTHLLELVGQSDPAFSPEPPSIYAAACRSVPSGRKHLLETWSHRLQIGQSLPTLPLWLAENFAVPLDLETSYERTCHSLRIS